MPNNPEIKQYQLHLRDILRAYFQKSELEIVTEWRTVFDRGIYSPRVDVAVGPFAIQEGVRYIDEYEQLMNMYKALLLSLISFHLVNIRYEIDEEEVLWGVNSTNYNPRCFMAIEVENSGSRKHLMGDVVNASSLGKVGIAVAWTPSMLRAFLNLRRYFLYLFQVKKNTFNAANLLLLDKDQLIEAIYRLL